MKRLVLACAISVIAAHASAADLGPRYPTRSPAPVFNWTGVYVGGTGGYGWGDSTAKGNYLMTDGFFTGSLAGTFSGADSSSLIESWNAGGLIGFNYQVSRDWLVGVEADFQWTGNETNSVTLGSLAGPTFTTSGSLDWFGTVRGRLGLVFDRALIYATGGFAYGRVQGDVTVTQGVAPALGASASGSDSAILTGWVVGGGLEYAVANNWTVRAEYLYVDLGSGGLTMPLSLPTNTVGTEVGITQSIARGAINYRF